MDLEIARTILKALESRERATFDEGRIYVECTSESGFRAFRIWRVSQAIHRAESIEGALACILRLKREGEREIEAA